MLPLSAPNSPVPETDRCCARALPGRAAIRNLWLPITLAAAFVATLYLQGARGIYDPDEGRYSAVALQMVRSGDWFTPRLNEELPHFAKPPLTYWVLAASMRVLGETEWALRLPLALANAGTVLLTWAMARRLVPRDPGLPAVVQATSLLPVVAATLVTSDVLLMVWESLAVFAFVVLWWDPPTTRRWPRLLLWAGFGLAFLTKGPPGLLPLVAILAFASWSEGWRGVRRLVTLGGLLVFGLVGLTWFGAQEMVRPDLVPYLVGREVVGRVAGEHLRNPGWTGLVAAFLPVVALGLFPWNLVLWRRGQPGSGGAPADAGRFLALWLVVPLAVFCAAQSRLPLYLLPLSVPAALLVGRRLAGWRPRWALPALFLWATSIVGLLALAAVVAHPRDGRRFALELGRILSEVPSEVVFVDQKPRWSLELYLGCKVESVQVVEDLLSRGGPSYRPMAETLDSELAERESGAVYLVPRRSLGPWREGLEARGWQVFPKGALRGYDVFATEPPQPPPSVDDLRAAAVPAPAPAAPS